MIKLFRNIRQKLLAEGKTTNYLKYAFGEIVLVVIGILIALQVNNSNENRRNYNIATKLKSRLINDITADIETMNKRLVFFETISTLGYSVEEEMTQHNATTIDDHWQFIVNVFHTSQLWNFSPTTTTYNEIQNSNLIGYIGSTELSNKLSEYYVYAPKQLAQIDGGTTAYRDYTRSIVPIRIQEYIWKNCYNSVVMGTHLIIDCKSPEIDANTIESLYQSIISDQNFKKLLTNRLSTIYVRNALYKINIQFAESLISNINPDI